jgi:hypothetical protein
MKDQEGAHHHPRQPERAQPQEPHRYRVDHYGKSRNFAAYEGQTIIAVTLYRKGAAEIIARLEEKDGRIAALESQLATRSESQVFPDPFSAGQCQPLHGHHRGNLPVLPPRTCQPIASPRHGADLQAPSADLKSLHLLLSQHKANIPSASNQISASRIPEISCDSC